MLRWLHLSDLHFRKADAWDADPFIRGLLEDIARVSEDAPPHLVLVTGDIAFSGKSEEYALARKFFDALLARLKLPTGRLFTVPGNHDVDRGLVSRGARLIVDSLRKQNDQVEIARLFESDPDSAAILAAPFREYAKFAPPVCTVTKERLWWVHRISTPTLPIPVILWGLNTAWTAHGDETKGSLVVGRYQVEKMLAQEPPEASDLVIALGHHPLSWATEWDEHEVERRLMYRADFFLRGHLHQARELEFCGGAREIAAGSAYADSRYPNSYSVATVNPSGGEALVRVRTYSPDRGGVWKWDLTVGSDPRQGDAQAGTIRLRLPQRLAPSARNDLELKKWNPAISPPGALLRSDFEVVPFHGRDRELQLLEEWCRDPARIKVRLCTASAGMGKSRLAIQFTKQVIERGWIARTFLESSRIEGHTLAEAADARPLLLVVDYAETRTRDLVSLLTAALTISRRSVVRVLFLSRRAGDWWETLRRSTPDVSDLLQGPACDRLSLGPLAASVEERTRSYRLAASAFMQALGRNIELSDSVDLAGPVFERVLLIHMAALAKVDAPPDEPPLAGAGPFASEPDQALLNYTLTRERRYWALLARERELPVGFDRAVGQAMAAFTLFGGARSESHALEVAGRIPLLRSESVAVRSALVRLLHDAYPGTASDWIEPLQPDILGEHLVQLELGTLGEDFLRAVSS